MTGQREAEIRFQAAALHGSAINQGYAVTDRLGFALAALDLYEAEVERLEAAYDERGKEIERLRHLLGSHADGHRCTCTMVSPAVYHGGNAGPAEWEQDPWCLTHPDMDYITAEVERLRALTEADPTSVYHEVATLRAQVAAVEAWAEHIPHIGDCRTPDEPCSCRTIQIRQDFSAALASANEVQR